MEMLEIYAALVTVVALVAVICAVGLWMALKQGQQLTSELLRNQARQADIIRQIQWVIESLTADKEEE